MMFFLAYKLNTLFPHKIVFLIFFLFPFALESSEQFDWKLYRRKEGILIFVAKQAHKSGLVPLKVQTLINHPMSKVVTVLNDQTRRTEWVPRLISNKVIKKINQNKRIDYSHYSSPWPFKDRTFVTEVEYVRVPEMNAFKTLVRSVEVPHIPLHKNRIRAHMYSGTFLVVPQDNNTKTFMEVILLTDFKGNIPNWVINMIQKQWPYKMFQGLTKQLNKQDVEAIPELLPTGMKP